MLGTPFYNANIRKTIAVFGSMFNDIHVIRKDELDVVQNDIKVPLSYAQKQAWHTKLRKDLAANDPSTNLTLPRMAFEMTGLSYDPARKTSTFNKRLVSGANPDQKRLMRQEIPYNMDFELNIVSKNIEDALQIVEQILPFFQPDLNVPINFNTEFGMTKDVPFILDSQSPDDNYEAGFADNRMITWTFSFTAKSWISFPIVDAAIIKKTIIQIANNILANGDWNFDVELTSAVDPLAANEEDDWTITRTNTEL